MQAHECRWLLGLVGALSGEQRAPLQLQVAEGVRRARSR